MEDEAASTTRAARKDTARVVVSLVPLLVLVWTIHTGYKLMTETRRYARNQEANKDQFVLVFGIVTIVFGLIYFIIGLSIVAELLLDLSAWLQHEDIEAGSKEAKEHGMIYQFLIRTFATALSMLMLTWTIYCGFKLASETLKNSRYNGLGFLTGVITIAFGLIYFLIGIAIVADSALNLSGWLQHEVKDIENHQGIKPEKTILGHRNWWSVDAFGADSSEAQNQKGNDRYSELQSLPLSRPLELQRASAMELCGVISRSWITSITLSTQVHFPKRCTVTDGKRFKICCLGNEQGSEQKKVVMMDFGDFLLIYLLN